MPLVSSRATPVAIDIEPSVTMNADTLSNATHRPLTSPTASPLASPASTPSATMRPVCPGATPPAQTIAIARHHAGQRHHRADGKIEPADDEDQHLSRREMTRYDELRSTLNMFCSEIKRGTNSAMPRPAQRTASAAIRPSGAQQPLRERIEAERSRVWDMSAPRRLRRDGSCRALAEEVRQHCLPR